MYELTCPTKPARNASHSEAGGENLAEIITKFNGEILEENSQGDLNTYLFEIDKDKIVSLDKELRLKGLRCLIVRKEEKKVWAGHVPSSRERELPAKAPKVQLEELDKKLEEILEEEVV